MAKSGKATFYVRALGATCYNREGVTFPRQVAINLEERLAEAGAENLRWEDEFGWSNQPPVLVMELPKNGRGNADLPQALDHELFGLGLLVVTHWDE